jgi:hypothetical protein
MTLSVHACPGESNPNVLLDAKTVREIRLLHLCDGISASQIARDLQMNVSCISRIVNWKAWAHQDEDLKVIPKPVHKGGGWHNRKPKTKSLEPVSRITCHTCVHLNDKSGVCDFGFPECLSSAYKYAAKCCVYKPTTSISKHGIAN